MGTDLISSISVWSILVKVTISYYSNYVTCSIILLLVFVDTKISKIEINEKQDPDV